MDPVEIAAGLAEFEQRAPGSDSERRAALWLRRRLREVGREAVLEPAWVRPQWPWVHSIHAALGLAGAVVAAFQPLAGIIILAVTTYSTLGNFAIFFEVAAAAYLDGSRERIRLLPFVLPAFLISLATVTRSALAAIFQGRPKEEVLWHKTEHNNRGRRWS